MIQSRKNSTRESGVGGEQRRISIFFHLISITASLLFILPLVWMVIASLRQPGLPPPRTIEWIPDPVAWSNYAQIFQLIPLGRYILNSSLVAGFAVCITLVTASWAGFAMAQLGPRGQDRFINLSIILLLIPVTAVWLARFILFRWLGFYNTFLALLAPSIMGSSPLFVLLFYWAFRRIPDELYEAARVEGASALTIWWRVAVPLSSATLVAVGILAFLMYWSDFITPLLYLKSQSLYTLPVGIRQLQELDRTNWPLLMAGAVVMTLPAILLFGVVQRFFLQKGRLAGMYGR